MTKKALVVVLGELARSPRMQYHCMSLAKNGYKVTAIATGSNGHSTDKSFDEVESNRNITKLLMSDNVNFKKFLPSFLAYIVKPIWQTILLIIQLCLATVPHVIILQNPPSIPTLPIMYIYSRLVSCHLVIDWHNYGYSILSLNLKCDHPLVRLSKFIEIYFGRLADAGLCVSGAMQRDLVENFKITYPLYVLYDRPPNHFKPLSIRKKHDFFLRIQDQVPAFKSTTKDWYCRDVTPLEHRETKFTITEKTPPYNVLARPDRPAIVLSSTSWTEDEDFDLLLNALLHYDATVTNQYNLEYDQMAEEVMDKLPKLVCVITGKGPLKSHYEDKIRRLKFEHIEIVLPWLRAEDYARMVGSCDLGISLHSSSSGVDLPMKVVDLFGCGIPVLAYKYKAINELVVEDFYGLTFKDSQDLFLQLTQLLSHFYRDENAHQKSEFSPIERFKKNIARHFLNSRWETNWKNIVRPLLVRLQAT